MISINCEQVASASRDPEASIENRYEMVDGVTNRAFIKWTLSLLSLPSVTIEKPGVLGPVWGRLRVLNRAFD